jgi:hypothetical protein
MVKDHVRIDDLTSLDEVIARLTELRDNLAAGCDAELNIRGDEYFGRHLAISYRRPLTAAEAACEGRYTDLLDRRLKAA